MVNNMHTNLDHDVFIKKGKSIALAEQVADFLKAQGKSEPTQIPFGHSEMAKKHKVEGYNAQSTMREIMFNAVTEAKNSKPGTAPRKSNAVLRERIEDITTDAERLVFNRHARETAWSAGADTFIGVCHIHKTQVFSIRSNGSNHRCRICIAGSNKKHRELAKQVTA